MKRKASYNPKVVTAYFKSFGIPAPEYEFIFHPKRKWCMDIAWPIITRKACDCADGYYNAPVFLEVQGGIFSYGRHNRGAALLKEWEKINTASGMGYRPLFCQPSELMTEATVNYIKTALGIK